MSHPYSEDCAHCRIKRLLRQLKAQRPDIYANLPQHIRRTP